LASVTKTLKKASASDLRINRATATLGLALRR
jgi:hypothetical protein